MDRLIKTIVWSSRAAKDLKKTGEFYKVLYGKTKTREILLEIRDSIKILESSEVDLSKIGSIDDAFKHLNQEYRKLFQHHCKITYREGNKHIYIVRVFDTRQDPLKNK